MKKRNIGICIITTTLLMGSHANATELILAKDHTNVVNQAAEVAAYKSNRPPVNKRLFTSKAVEAEIPEKIVKSYIWDAMDEEEIECQIKIQRILQVSDQS